MIRKYLFPLLALCGVIFALWMVNNSSKALPVAQPVAAPATADFSTFVAGAGIVEPRSENIAVAPVVGGVIKEVHVTVGQRVKKGDPLFTIDARDLQAQLLVQNAQLASAREQLGREISLPRAESVPPLEALVKEAEARYEDARAQYAILEKLPDRRAVSEDEWQRRKWAVEVASAQIITAKANYDLAAAGTWKPELAIAQAGVQAAQAAVDAIQIEMDRRITRAPIDGKVLQVRARPGEFAQAGLPGSSSSSSDALMILGDTDTLHVRVDVDENDAWRIVPNAPAHASVRGNSSLKTDLSFVRVEPLVIPKRSLTGDSSERVDTRVLQVIYSFPASSLTVYVGQQMDVFIEATSGNIPPATQK